MKKILLILVCSMLVGVMGSPVGAYDYPFRDPYVATMVDGILREDEDFGQTLGFYGLGPGPYMVLPILGPSKVRDTAGLAVDTVVYSLMMQELIGLTGMDSPEDDILNYSLTAIYAIDKRHNESFRYFNARLTL